MPIYWVECSINDWKHMIYILVSWDGCNSNLNLLVYLRKFEKPLLNRYVERLRYDVILFLNFLSLID